jgi:hypothetical protein
VAITRIGHGPGVGSRPLDSYGAGGACRIGVSAAPAPRGVGAPELHKSLRPIYAVASSNGLVAAAVIAKCAVNGHGVRPTGGQGGPREWPVMVSTGGQRKVPTPGVQAAGKSSFELAGVTWLGGNAEGSACACLFQSP